MGKMIQFGCSVVGLLAGFVFALIGMGPGMIIVSSLHLMCGYDLKKAATGSLFLLIPVSVASVVSHYLYSDSFSPFIPWILCGSLVGVDLGLLIRKRSSSKTLRLIFTIFLCLVILRHFSKLLELPVAPILISTPFEWYHHIMIGGLASLLSACMGIGGGVLIMASYFGLLGFPVKEVAVISACVVCLNSILSSFKSRKDLYWDRNLTNILSSGLIGAFVGGLVSSKVSEDFIAWLVGGFLLIVFFNMIKSLFEQRTEAS